MRRWLCLWMICVPTLALAKDAPAYRWLRGIELPEITATTLVAVPLDSHFFQFTRAGRPDVRLSNDEGAAIGFVIRAASEMKTRSIRTFWTAEQTAAKVDDDIGLQVEVALRDKQPAPNGIRIFTPLRDFKHQVRIESSGDGMTWTSVGPPTVIFDYSRYVDARSDLVPLTVSDHRRFRVTIEDITAEQEFQLMELRRRLRGREETERTESTTISRRPFRIDRIEFYRDDPTAAASGERQMTEYPVSHFTATENEKDHQTILTFDTQREPITQIKVITAAENFSRAVTVEAEFVDVNGQTIWRNIATTRLTRFAIGTIHRDDLTLAIEEVGAQHYRVVIENGDSPRLPITGVELSGPLYELTFLASARQHVRLEYASPTAPAGKFDTAALQAALAQPQSAVIAILQPPRENANIPADSWVPWNDRRVLVGTILVLTLLLGWGLFHAGQRLNSPPEK